MASRRTRTARSVTVTAAPFLSVTVERPAPDSQAVDYAADRVRTVAQSHMRMGAGEEERTICWA
jgi:hypothetical protein